MAKQTKTVTVSTVGYLCYAEDVHDNFWSALIDDTSDTVCVYDLFDREGKPFSFNSEAHKLSYACKGTGISYSITEISVQKNIVLELHD